MYKARKARVTSSTSEGEEDGRKKEGESKAAMEEKQKEILTKQITSIGWTRRSSRRGGGKREEI